MSFDVVAADVPMSYSGSWNMNDVRELRLVKEDDRSREEAPADEDENFLLVR